jgi:aminoglycoside phosphotransferase (APT) family kinase protein
MVPTAPLAAWLDRCVDGPGGAVSVSRIGLGRSNLTFRVERGGRAYVLRRPPLGELPETAHDVLREHRVLTALAATGVRAPRPVAVCTDPSVIGVPWYLMEVVEGTVVRDELPAAWSEADRADVGLELIDALAELHTADYVAAGLADLGRPQGYTGRQVSRWTRQWELMATRELPDVEVVRVWLEAHVPAEGPAAIVHGDYKLDNVVFSADSPPRLRAILDWEMATLGDPLADLGYLLNFWPEPGEASVTTASPLTQRPGFLPRAALVERYAAATGFELRDLTFYRTLAMWKLAILCEGLYKRFLAGNAGGDWYAVLEERVPRMARQARELAGA